jgi:hypothetical protein
MVMKTVDTIIHPPNRTKNAVQVIRMLF